MWEVSEKHNSVVELLLKTSNIDVNQKCDNGWCPLHLAVSSKKIEALKLLLDFPNIDVNQKDDHAGKCTAQCTLQVARWLFVLFSGS